ncbi:Phosphomethylpyrimidine kinase-domain-containing protein [Pseudoneurospora amorphoporcata]|uniref:Phosphomethylpyrimidine kinase-domain-containing protein n=1 Tax=Pseudoneurospora amorphoporcata TaxID=241081 RepID=A0AAN6P729_9PEZI|nr:Phosphomethylpyrimidine kinase-domain-containing protein [Pseudoneurospora amorphoporcata]
MGAFNDSGSTLPRVLVIAGSDSSGGAGLEADQKVIAAHGCYAMTATTALTAQNTRGVYGIHEVPVDFLRKQIDAVVEDVGVDVVKSGMLASASTIEAVAQAIHDHKLKTLVVDPVMIATTGAELLPNSASRALREKLLPLATILTPNVSEANTLLLEAGHDQRPVQSVADLEEIALKVQKLGSKWVLVKGGHSPFRRDGTEAKTEDEKEIVVNVLVGPAAEGTKRAAEGEEKLQVVKIEMSYQRSRNTHGTGCSLASAIASNLAKGMGMVSAVKAGIRYVDAAIRTAPGLGKGNGPLNHFHSVKALPFSPGHFLDYLLERPDVAPVWDRYIYHPFVMAMGDGTLPRESFKGYLMQDYVYLIHYARANALASYKAKNIEDVAGSAAIVANCFREMNLHVQYCAGFGISKEQMEKTEEHMACTAYTRYVLDMGQSEDWFALQIALAPCLLGYGAIAAHLHASPTSKTGEHENLYWTWIANYVADDYTTAVQAGRELLERHAVLQSPGRIEELVRVFVHATKMEIGFWEMFPYKDEEMAQ